VAGGDGGDVGLGDRPEIGKRSSTADEYSVRLSKSIEPVNSQRTGKTKKFMRLRKALGLKG